MLKRRWHKWLFASVVLLISHGFVLWHADDIKAFWHVKSALGDHGEAMAVKSDYSGKPDTRIHIQAGVLVPDELLSGDFKTDYNFAKSFLSGKQEWLLIETGRLPKITGLKGMGFGFKTTNSREELTLK